MRRGGRRIHARRARATARARPGRRRAARRAAARPVGVRRAHRGGARRADRPADGRAPLAARRTRSRVPDVPDGHAHHLDDGARALVRARRDRRRGVRHGAAVRDGLRDRRRGVRIVPAAGVASRLCAVLRDRAVRVGAARHDAHHRGRAHRRARVRDAIDTRGDVDRFARLADARGRRHARDLGPVARLDGARDGRARRVRRRVDLARAPHRARRARSNAPGRQRLRHVDLRALLRAAVVVGRGAARLSRRVRRARRGRQPRGAPRPAPAVGRALRRPRRSRADSALLRQHGLSGIVLRARHGRGLGLARRVSRRRRGDEIRRLLRGRATVRHRPRGGDARGRADELPRHGRADGARDRPAVADHSRFAVHGPADRDADDDVVERDVDPSAREAPPAALAAGGRERRAGGISRDAGSGGRRRCPSARIAGGIAPVAMNTHGYHRSVSFRFHRTLAAARAVRTGERQGPARRDVHGAGDRAVSRRGRRRARDGRPLRASPRAAVARARHARGPAAVRLSRLDL
ncbi:hypothetical protein BURPS1710b_2242 [Burkholderia pseudomallei 1710b]|uniref:Uncharacterized protein n=1 Tax=Burkholderia pseudomallei (strain 1710b) TaxID=320372 RepID=Q3JS16_BURP1|nr:hypothetical protein BURPS1710b_2242 [Burkholderia pseudomallei 1710b]